MPGATATNVLLLVGGWGWSSRGGRSGWGCCREAQRTVATPAEAGKRRCRHNPDYSVASA